MNITGPRRFTADHEPLDVVLRLAVLLSAGLSAPDAWRHLAADGPPGVRAVADAAARGDDVARVLRAQGAAWRDLAAVWSTAAAVGAPLADTLRGVAAALREATEIRDEVRVALAEPRSTARLLAWLPAAGVPLGSALGFDVIGVLTGDALGVGCLVGGIGLAIAARVWSARLVRAAQPPTEVPGLRAEVFAIALSGGVSIDAARRVVDDALDAGPAIDPAHRPSLASPPDGADEIERTLALSERAGVPARELLRGIAWLARQRARSEGRAAAARLSIRLVLPLGLCTLPAFLVLAVAPMILGIVRTEVVPL